MAKLEGPYELLDLPDGGILETKITGYDVGEMDIHPGYSDLIKQITGLRIHVPPEMKDYFPYYWDITSQTLVAQLLPYLEKTGYGAKTFKITKHGVAPRARFTLEVK